MAAILAIAGTGSASAHGDPASHYLETDALYPSFARQPSVEAQLQLMGLLQATERRGYPIKVALVAGVEDLVDDVGMLRTPQRYASTVASLIDRELEAPVVVVTPYGIGIDGTGVRNGVRRPVTPADARQLVGGLEVAGPEGDDLAGTAMAAVRRVARAGGHPLPKRVAPAEQAAPPAVAATGVTPVAEPDGGGTSVLWAVPALVFAIALLVGYRRRPRSPLASKA